MINFRAEVRADLLAEFGVDLAEWFGQRRWRALLELIDQLPASCRLNEAIFNDPAEAEVIASQPEPEGDWSPRLSEYNLTAMLLREVREAVISVRSALFTVNGHRPPKVPILPAPRTAVDDFRDKQRRDRQLDIVKLFAPHALETRERR